MQASCDQYVDSSGLSEDAGPAVGCGVVEKAPWRALRLKDGIATLADPLQGMGDAAENEGAHASRPRWVPCQQQGAWPSRVWAAAAPEVGAGLFLSQAVPMLLVLQAAEQHLVQSHSEVLLVCGVRDKACQWRERERGHSERLLNSWPLQVQLHQTAGCLHGGLRPVQPAHCHGKKSLAHVGMSVSQEAC